MTETTTIEPCQELDDWEPRALAAYYRRCNQQGWIPDQPSQGAECVKLTRKKDGMIVWERVYLLLANTHGILGCYRVQKLTDGTDRLKWIDRIPSQIVAAYGNCPVKHQSPPHPTNLHSS